MSRSSSTPVTPSPTFSSDTCNASNSIPTTYSVYLEIILFRTTNHLTNSICLAEVLSCIAAPVFSRASPVDSYSWRASSIWSRLREEVRKTVPHASNNQRGNLKYLSLKHLHQVSKLKIFHKNVAMYI